MCVCGGGGGGGGSSPKSMHGSPEYYFPYIANYNVIENINIFVVYQKLTYVG